MRDINQFDLSPKSYPSDDQVKLKYQKIPRYLKKIKNGWNGTQSIKNHVILLKMKTKISQEFLTQNSQSVIRLRKLNY